MSTFEVENAALASPGSPANAPPSVEFENSSSDDSTDEEDSGKPHPFPICVQEMDDEIKRQTPIMDAMDEKLDSTTSEMRTANGKLKKVITSMRSTRNFCVDVILIFLILGIAMFFFNSFG